MSGLLPQNWVEVGLWMSIYQNCGQITTISPQFNPQIVVNCGIIGVVVMAGGYSMHIDWVGVSNTHFAHPCLGYSRVVYIYVLISDGLLVGVSGCQS